MYEDMEKNDKNSSWMYLLMITHDHDDVQNRKQLSVPLAPKIFFHTESGL